MFKWHAGGQGCRGRDKCGAGPSGDGGPVRSGGPGPPAPPAGGPGAPAGQAAQAPAKPKAKVPLDELESIRFERTPAMAARFMGQPNVDFTMPGLSAKKEEPPKKEEPAKKD